jgi:predicted phage terminase large subunit-like protein
MQLEMNLKRQLILTPTMKTLLKRYNCTASDPEQRYLEIHDLRERLEEGYHEELRSAAHDSLSCYIEYMTPDEPPPEHIDYLCENVLEPIERGDIMRASISVSTGYAKSKTCSQLFPSWYMGRNPFRRFIQGGHSQAFVESNCGKVVRDWVADPKYQTVFPNIGLHPRFSGAGNWKLSNARGGYVCKGVGQKIAGYRGHIGSCDDLIGSWEDADSEGQRETVWRWLWGDFRRRLLPGSPLFLIMTRWHPDDPIGRIEEMNKKGIGLPWHIINLNVIIENEQEMAEDPLGRSIGEVLWPSFFTKDHVLEVKATSSPREWYAFDKGKPRVAEGNIIKSDWFKRYDRLPTKGDASTPRTLRRITVSVDCAKKATQRADYTAITVWYEDLSGKHYLAHVIKEKLEFNEMITKIETTAEEWEANAIIVEDEGNGTAYIQQRSGLAPAPIIAIPAKAEGSKWNRLDACAPMFEAGLVLFPRQAPWWSDYQDEILDFPNATNDDQVDSTTQYLLRSRKKGKFGTQRLRGGARQAA